jgi:hypothetical protein
MPPGSQPRRIPATLTSHIGLIPATIRWWQHFQGYSLKTLP